MSTRTRLATAVLVALAAFGLVVGPAGAAEVENGSFETGDLTGWTEADFGGGGAGDFEVHMGYSYSLDEPEVEPACGDYQAVSDQGDPTATALYQDIELEADAEHVLTLESWFYIQSGKGPVGILYPDPDTLDPEVDEGNEQARIEVIDPAADPFTVDPDDIWATVWLPEEGETGDPTWTEYETDLSDLAGQTVRLRAAVAVNVSPLHLGLDCVEVTSTPLEPTTTTPVVPAPVAPAAQAQTLQPAFTG